MKFNSAQEEATSFHSLCCVAKNGKKKNWASNSLGFLFKGDGNCPHLYPTKDGVEKVVLVHNVAYWLMGHEECQEFGLAQVHGIC